MTNWRGAAAAVALFACVSSEATAASDAAAVKQTIRSFVAKMNAGDQGVLALCTDTGSIVDEFAPFHWAQFAAWGTAYDDYAHANNISDTKITLLKFAHVNVSGGNAYVVASAIYSYKDTKPHKETGTETYSLTKGDKGWQINSFAWFGKEGVDSGTDADAVVAAVKDFAAGKTAPGGPPTAITDEFAPYSWQGADAAQGWFAGLQKDMTEGHESDLVITPQAPSQLSVNGNEAYATFPTVLTSKHNGKPARELGSLAFAFEKTDGNWRIVSWAWATK